MFTPQQKINLESQGGHQTINNNINIINNGVYH